MVGNNNKFNVSAFLLHLHPRKVHAETLRFTLSYGLGGMAVTLLCLLFLTGILQLLSYTPQIDTAYLSVVRMYGEKELSGFIRNIHHWSGNLLVVVVFLHMLRVFLTGALTGGRQVNWLLGIILFLAILFANFTGYLLPWDQLAYWAVTIFISMTSYLPLAGEHIADILRGGPEVGAETLAIFFAIHVGIIPLILLFFSIWHFWMIRKAGGLVRQVSDGQQARLLPTVPHLISRELGVGFVLLALVLVFAAVVDAPLDVQANPGESPNPAKAAWYFLGLQELLLHLHPLFAICVVPAFMLAGVIGIPYWKDAVLPQGVWFGGEKRGKVAAGWSVAMGSAVVIFLVLMDDYFLSRTVDTTDGWIFRGVLPIFGYCCLQLSWFFLWRKKYSCTRAEAAMAVALLVMATSVTLTAIGVWFRGKEMHLIWPFT